MISFAYPLALLLALPLFAFTFWVWRSAYAHPSTRRGRLSITLRLIILVLIVLALAGTGLRLPQNREAMVVVADLSASDYGARSATQALIAGMAAARPTEDALGVVSVGRQPMVEQPVQASGTFDGFQTVVDPRYTNLAGGLDLSNAILPPGYRHRILLVSDGRQNVGDALSTARLLRSQGVRVDVSPARVKTGPEVLVDRVDVPPQLRPRESFPLTVTIHSTVRTSSGITLTRDNTLIGSRTVSLGPGNSTFTFPQAPLAVGFHTFQVEITPARDTQAENNSGTAFTTVQGAPRILVIAAQPAAAANVVRSLTSTGAQPELRRPAAVTADLGWLQTYAAVVIVDTAATSLSTALMGQLVPYVRDLGHGLVVVGGQNAYSMGGYGNTPLEQVLPVTMNFPKRRQTPTVAVALIIESLEENTQINISKEAGKGVVSLLTPQDQVAVSDAPYDGSPGWVVPIQHVANKALIDNIIDRMAPGDPESYTPILESAYSLLKRSGAKVKHIILLGDGDAEDPSYQTVVQNIRAGGVTVSTVATNGAGRSDASTMIDIARWGGGRSYSANDPARIPDIFLREARTIARQGIVTGTFYPEELSSNPMLRDVTRVAPLTGYVATTPKGAAEVVLASKRLDPVLAAWQYGLGRAVAWTSDAAGLWSSDWLRAPGANRFWSNLVSWTLPAAGGSTLTLTSGSSQGQGHLTVTTPSSLGADPSVAAHVLDPAHHTSTVQLEPSAPGQFAGSFPENQRGAYFVTVEAHGAGHAAAGQVGLDVSYSPEYRSTGLDLSFLRTVAVAGGGSVITSPGAAWRGNLPSVQAQDDLTLLLLLLAVLLLPIDVGVRRLVMSRRELRALVDALPWRVETPGREEPVSAPLGAVRARRASRPTRVPPTPFWAAGKGGPTVPHPESKGPPTPGTITAPEHDSTAARLLAARRRKE